MALALESGCRIFTSCASYSEPAFGFTTGLDVGSVTTVTASDWSAGFFSIEIQFIFLRFFLVVWYYSFILPPPFKTLAPTCLRLGRNYG